MIIAVDFDGTCVTHEFPKVGEDIGAQSVLKELVDRGHQLILWTMRSDCEDNNGSSDEFPHVSNGKFLTDALDWFKKNEIPLFGCQCNPDQKSWTTSPKCYAHLYIDDAALGCPLILPGSNDYVVSPVRKVKSSRPYVDWDLVRKYLIQNDIL